MINKTAKYTAITFVTILNLLVLLMWLGHLSFGHGLGDIAYLGYYTLLAAVGYITVIVNKNTYVNLFLILVFIIANFLFIQKATIGRGPEQRWDGNLMVLYRDCEVEVKNNDLLMNK